MVAYLDRGFVEDGKIEVGKEEVAHLDIAAIIAIEGLVDDGPDTTLAEQGSDGFFLVGIIGRYDLVILPYQVLDPVQFVDEFRGESVIYLSAHHLLPRICHKCVAVCYETMYK